jgi:hypothetical protein
MASGAFALDSIAPETFARVFDSASNVQNIPSQLAAASAGWSNIWETIVCKLFSTCEQQQLTTATEPQPQLPPQQKFQTATSTSSELARVVQQTVVHQPVIERVRESVRTIVEGGITRADLTEALDAVRGQFSREISAVAANVPPPTAYVSPQVAAGGSTVIYQSAPAAQKIDTLDGVTITNATLSDGSISGTSLPAGDLTGVTAVANGGTGTSTAPTYGKLLLGNSSGMSDLVATSSLGITGGTTIGANFGQTFELASGALSPTTTVGFIVSASSTFNGGVSFDCSTTTHATSTSLFASLGRLTTAIVDTLPATAANIASLTASTITATNATTTRLDALDYVAVGRTSTTTILGSATSTFGAGIQTTALNVTSSGASSTFANGINLSGGCYAVSGTCLTSVGGGAPSFGQSWELSGGFLAPTTSVKLSLGQASSTLFSAHQAFFGATATSSFSSAGILHQGTADLAADRISSLHRFIHPGARSECKLSTTRGAGTTPCSLPTPTA